MAGRFAATLRRYLYRGKALPPFPPSKPNSHNLNSTSISTEHLGLIPPQSCTEREEEVTSHMRPAPVPTDYEIGTDEDAAVADPLADSTLELFDGTARKNRVIFTECFRTVPSNLVRDYKSYEVRFSFFFSFWFSDLYLSLMMCFCNPELCPESQSGPRRAGHPARPPQGASLRSPRSTRRLSSRTSPLPFICFLLDTLPLHFFIPHSPCV